MRINHNIASMVGQGAIFQASNALNKTLEKLSTGLRVNRASDDAAGLAISEKLRSQVNGLAVAQRNAQDGIALMQIAEGAMNEISSILQRMRELSLQSANDTLTSSERNYTNQEYSSLLSEIDRIANTTTYNGMSLLNGSGFGGAGQAASILHIGANADASNEITITIDTMSTTSLDITGGSLSSNVAALSAITSLDAAINSVNSARADLGAYVNRLEHSINNMMNQATNTQAAESYIRDADFALETANFTKNSILIQSATAMLAQANMAPQSVLSLLGY